MARFIPLFGDLLSDARKRKGYSVRQACYLTGAAERVWYTWEDNSKCPPKAHVLLRICLVLGLEEKQILWAAAEWYRRVRDKGSTELMDMGETRKDKKD